jgi:hemerythrin
MAVGDVMIDGDHQKLIGLINDIEVKLTDDGTSIDLGAGLDQLVAYTQQHFEREENLMRYLQYNGLIHHRQAHRELRARLAEIRIAVEAAKAESVPAEEKQRLVMLLRSWLLDHVLKEDMLLKAFLKEVS